MGRTWEKLSMKLFLKYSLILQWHPLTTYSSTQDTVLPLNRYKEELTWNQRTSGNSSQFLILASKDGEETDEWLTLTWLTGMVPKLGALYGIRHLSCWLVAGGYAGATCNEVIRSEKSFSRSWMVLGSAFVGRSEDRQQRVSWFGGGGGASSWVLYRRYLVCGKLVN